MIHRNTVGRWAVILVVLMLGSTTAALAGGLPPGGTFTDDDGNTHEGNIEAIAAAAITRGCDAIGALYCPSDQVTRAQMASFIARALDLPPASDDYFADDATSTHQENINRLREAGVTLGCNAEGTLYCPDDSVSRAQMASFLARALDLPAATDDWFDDDEGNTHEDNINRIADAGVTLGCEVGLYCPDDAVLRDQMASFLARALGLDPIMPPPRFADTACLVTDTAGIDDGAFNEISWHGALAAAAEINGLTVFFLESQTEADFRPNIDAFVNQGCDLIITVGFQLGDATAAAANDNPSRHFAIVDIPVGDFPPWCVGIPPMDGTCGGTYVGNVRGSTFETGDAAFLAGYLAAGMTDSGAVGTFGGFNIPAVTMFMDGFVWGVDHYNSVKGASVTALGWDPDTQTGLFSNDFSDPALGRQLAEDLVDLGADIVLPVAGTLGRGSAAFCQDTGSCDVIGVDTDLAAEAPEFADVALTSVVRNMDAFVFETIQNLVATGTTGGEYVGTLANGGSDIAPYHNFEGSVPQQLQDEVDQLRQAVIDGTVVPGG